MIIINCMYCGKPLNPKKDHRCGGKPEHKTYVISWQYIQSMHRQAEEGKCPYCRGTGEIRISHLKTRASGIGVEHSHVEKNRCKKCKGSGEWKDVEPII